jgi:hypothetical protein
MTFKSNKKLEKQKTYIHLLFVFYFFKKNAVLCFNIFKITPIFTPLATLT